MTSKTIPPEDERVTLPPCPLCGDRLVIGEFKHPDRVNYRLLCMSNDDCFFMDFDDKADAMLMANRRSTQPDREAIIEECARIADRMQAQAIDSRTAQCALNLAKAIRSLKHSDTTSNGGKNG